MTLNDINIGQISAVCSLRIKNSSFRKKLLSMGMTLGTHLKILKKAPLGGPLEIQLRGYQLVLRRSEAQLIEVLLL